MTKNALAALLLLSAGTISPLVGQGDDEDTRKALAGLKGVLVEVFVTDTEESRRDGLVLEQLQTDVELKLREAGIRVFSREEPWTAALVANVLEHKTSSG